MTPEPTTGMYRLSFMQQGLLYHSLADPDAAFYVDQVLYTLNGNLDEERLARAWQRATERHETLRTSFHWEGIEELVQVVHPSGELPYQRLDWRDRPAGRQAADLEDFLTEDRLRGFDLDSHPLFRLSTVRLADEQWAFAFRYHHLLLDAWSALLVLEEVFDDYEREGAGLPVDRQAPPPYRSYVAWLHSRDLTEAEAHWRTALGGFGEPTPLPGRLHPAPDPATRGTGAGERENPEEVLSLPAPLTSALLDMARERRLTLNTVLQSAWALLLGRHGGRDDVVFGATVSNRPVELDGIERTAGLFINTLPVRVGLDPSVTFADCCERLQKAEAERRAFDGSPLMEVQSWSDLPSGTLLFDTIMTFLNVPGISVLDGRDGELHVTGGAYRYRTNYPLSVMVLPGTELTFRLGYDRAHYDQRGAARLLQQLRTILEAVIHDPLVLLRDIPVLPAEQEDLLLGTWGDATARTADPVTASSTAHEVVMDIARRMPDAAALVHGSGRLTYRELSERSARLARYLRGLGVGPDTAVGVCLERGVDLPVAFLAVLLAGGAYMPLDPSYPGERLHLMLRDANPPVVLTHKRLRDRLPREGRRTVLLDAHARAIGRESADPLDETGVHPDNLAYLIYTSGSSGTPKGTMLTHRGLANLIRAQRAKLGITPEDRVLQWASASFDASVFEMVMALGAGARLHLAGTDEVMPGDGLLALLTEARITALTIPPTALAALPEADLPDLRLLLAAGEALPQALVDRWARPRRMLNAYGPTETSVWATADASVVGQAPSIGTPVAGFRCRVLDAGLLPVPVGAVGELFLGGDGLARGYHAQPARTAAAFLPDPYGPPGSRLYRTGDLVRWRDDGTLDFVGRSDDQVKLRGLRIELGEIEAALADLPGVREAVAVVRGSAAEDASEEGSAGSRIVAYAVAADTEDGAGLRERLEARLPGHMLPSTIVVLDRLPLTVNGKLDRAALPELDRAAGRPDRIRPRNETEEFVAEIWCAVLGVQDPSVTDDFFAAGGNSIKATQMGSRISRAVQVDIPLRDVLKARTIENCAALVDAALALELQDLTEDELRSLTQDLS
ncbi:amino acid adenylation domain-containing protein [Streptomyces goshikiensis]